MELEILREVRSDETPDAMNSFFDGVIQIIDDGNLKPLFEQQNHGVGADESGAAGDQNVNSRIGRRRRHYAPSKKLGKWRRIGGLTVEQMSNSWSAFLFSFFFPFC